MPTTNEGISFKYTKPSDRNPRKASASANLQQVHNQSAAAGGHAGTSASAGSYARRTTSSTTNPR